MINLLRRAGLPVLAILASLLLGAMPARAVVVDFDDLTGVGTVADGYGGINWNGEWTYYDLLNGNQYEPHSPATRVFPIGNAASGSFDFLSDAVFAGAWFNGTHLGGPIYFELFLDGILVHTSASLLLPAPIANNNTFLASGYAGPVDRVSVRSTANYWIMDDVTFDVASVPEPASMALLAGGLAGAVLLRRRMRRG